MLSAMIITMSLIQLLVPLGLAFLLLRRLHSAWRPLGAGLLAFLGYQVAQMPVMQALEGTEIYAGLETNLPQFTFFLVLGGVSSVIAQGMTAGGFWLVRNSIAEWKNGAAVALGYAGTGSLVIGLLQLVNFAFVASATSAGTASLAGFSPQEAASFQKYLDFYWAQPWYLPLSGMLQSMALLASQLSQGMMVWLALTRRAWIWAGTAVLWQIAIHGALLASTSRLEDPLNDLVYVLIAALNAGIFYFFCRISQARPLVEIVNQ